MWDTKYPWTEGLAHGIPAEAPDTPRRIDAADWGKEKAAIGLASQLHPNYQPQSGRTGQPQLDQK